MKIAILGATGAVGAQMIECLIEQNIKVDELKLLASKKSEGKIIRFKGKEIVVEEAKESSFDGMNVVLGAVGNEQAKYFSPFIQKAGAIFIDNSSAFRLDDDVPLVIPEINSDDIKMHKGVIANPNCCTIIALMALYGVNKKSKITHIIASTYQAVSGAGVEGINELVNQINGSDEVKVFKDKIAYNVIGEIGGMLSNGYTSEEEKLKYEGRKILHNPDLKVSCTCVRVPVIRSHSISINFKCEKKLEYDDIVDAIKKSEGVRYCDLPMPINTNNQDLVEVGRIRKDEVIGGYALWCTGDQIRKGAASNAVSIIKYLHI